MIFITSGGCKAPVDDVRHIGNFSSGRFGAEITDALSENIHGEVICMLAEKGSKTPSVTYHSEDEGKVLGVSNATGLGSIVIRKEYSWYSDYLYKALEINKSHMPSVIISAAAISDFVPKDQVQGKIKSEDEITITFKKTEKVLKLLREENKEAYIVGFKLMVSPTREETIEAVEKVLKYSDAVVFNDLTALRKADAVRRFYFRDESGNLCDVLFHGAYELVKLIQKHSNKL